MALINLSRKFFINNFIDHTKERKYTCPDCSSIYYNYEQLCQHVKKIHGDNIPPNSSVNQYIYDGTHPSRPKCRTCKTNTTAWNEGKMHYEWFCSDHCRKIAVDRLKNPAYQRKMLLGRSISGEYKFDDGGTRPFVGSYAEDFLRHCDTELKIRSDEIDGEVDNLGIQYLFEKEKCFYVADYYMKEYNLIIEIKDGGDNPNTHPGFAPNRIREKAKDEAVVKSKKYNYIKIVNKEYYDFDKLIEYFRSLNTTNQSDKKPIIIIPKNSVV